jgi:AcrR family transcriptional regulator
VLTPRKQPIQKRSMATVTAILEGAAQVLERHGSDGFTTNAIAERAGVSIGTLYQYYPDKNAIAAALSRSVRAALVERMASAMEVARGLPLREGLRLLTSAALLSDAARPRFARALDALEEHLGLNEEGLAINDELTAQGAQFLKRKLKGFSLAKLAPAADDMIAITTALADAELRRNGLIGDGLVERIVSLSLELLRSHLQLSPRRVSKSSIW